MASTISPMFVRRAVTMVLIVVALAASCSSGVRGQQAQDRAGQVASVDVAGPEAATSERSGAEAGEVAEPASPEPVSPEPVTATREPVQTPDATSTPEPTQTPQATATPAPTAATEPTETPDATATAEPTQTPEPTATAEPTPLPTARPHPDPDKTQVPTTYDGAIRALRTASGVVLTVRSEGPPYEVVTPCYALATVSEGRPVEGPIDVLIDPGHGGDETGAVSHNGIREADLNLDVAEALRDRLLDAGYSVLMTRYADYQMAIQARTELATTVQPRIFLSIHHNGGYPDPVDQPGTEIFVQQGSEESRRLGGILFEEVQEEFGDLDINWMGTDALGVSWRANEWGPDLYGILRRSQGVVTVLTEAMYMTEIEEAEFLATDEAIEREADALMRGIDRYLNTDHPGSGYIDGLVFYGRLGTGGGTEGCIDPALD